VDAVIFFPAFPDVWISYEQADGGWVLVLGRRFSFQIMRIAGPGVPCVPHTVTRPR
jgi:hypothetical protein